MTLESVIAVVVGLGLAAACGMRVFMPLFALAIGTRLGIVTPPDAMTWIAGWPALVALGTACTVEIAGYYIPWVDHLLDSIATPAAAIAGIAVMFIHSGWALHDLHPVATWGAALIGGGAATAVQAGTVATRAASTVTTGGLGNPIVSTFENIIAAVVSFVSLLLPIAVALAVITLVGLLIFFAIRRRARAAVPAALA